MLEALDGLVSMQHALANLDSMNSYWLAKLPADEESPATVSKEPRNSIRNSMASRNSNITRKSMASGGSPRR